MRILFSTVRKLACLFALSLPSSLAAESAKSIANRDGPAESPPAGFSGAQFVDSLGCVPIRGGQESTVQWVARMNSSRQAICGFAPSFAPEEAPIAQINPSATRTPVTDRQPAANDVAAPSKPLAPTALTVRGKIVPTAVPEGYRKAWDDGRLNIYSGLQSAEGMRAADDVWSRDVPSETSVHGKAPKPQRAEQHLIFAFLDIAQQRAFLNANGAYVLEPQDNGAIALVPKDTAATGGNTTATDL